MKKKILLALALVSVVVICYVEAAYGVSELVIEKATGKTPEVKVENYVKAVAAGDKEQAFALWVVPEKDGSSITSVEYYDGLKSQRETVTQDLIAKKISTDFRIEKVEWWSTCCEPRIIDNARVAGRAKLYVELTDSGGAKSTYIFDLSVPGGYDGGLTSHYVRDWKIDSVSLEK